MDPKPQSPLRAVDPQPMQDQASAAGNPYPTPPSLTYSTEPQDPQRYNTQGSRPHKYNPQDYVPQDRAPKSYDGQEYKGKKYRSEGRPGSRPEDIPEDFRTQDYSPQDERRPEYQGQDPRGEGYPPQETRGPEIQYRPYNPQDYPPPTASLGLVGNTPLGMRPDSRLAGGYYGTTTQMAQRESNSLHDLRALRTNCQFGIREYLSLQRQRRSGDTAMSPYELDNRIRAQTGAVLSDLKVLQSEVRGIAKGAANHRWRKWIIGGAIASFIPLVRRFWRKSDDSEDEDSKESSNDTEYAFRKSKGLVSYIQNSIFGTGKLAKFAFIVFAVLYVFSNEVSLRVARTVQKRIKKLGARIERGDQDIDEGDMKLLEGWRWRVLLW